MQIDATFVTSAAGTGDFPRERLPELAMVGRSNVGKSSLINALVRRPLARTSATPGKTRLANFYRVQRGTAAAFHLVDLPGYGYARGGDASAREFRRLAEAYFSRAAGSGLRASAGDAEASDRSVLAASPQPGARSPKPVVIAVWLLVDSRHPGLESDLEAWTWLQSQPVARAIVGTKVDKLSRAQRTRNAREFESLFQTPVLLVSAQTGEGLDELWKMIARLASQTVA
jgi:GTP-binding protein